MCGSSLDEVDTLPEKRNVTHRADDTDHRFLRDDLVLSGQIGS